MAPSIDLAAAILLAGILGTAALAFVIGARARGQKPHFARLDTVRALPGLGKAPLEVVYAAAIPFGRALALLGVSANTVTLASGVIATVAGYFFATGRFGLAAATASLAALADALDGIVARATGTASVFGQVLDTTVDRYVEALFVGSIAFLVRTDPVLLVIALAALVGGFMVSYASSVLRELGVADVRARMRRAHRLAYLLASALLVPFVQAWLPLASQRVQLAPVFVALAAIAIVGNVSAVQRLLGASRALSQNRRLPSKDAGARETPAEARERAVQS